MLVAMGAVPVFADVDPYTYTVSADDIRARATTRTRGVVGVHLFGNSCDIAGLSDLASELGVPTVWDAAQALGTEYKGREVGGYPAAVCYSFYPTKNITTGEGGMVATDDDVLATRLRLMRSQGAIGKYEHVTLGFNYRMTDLQAALGLSQLARLDGYLARRRENAAFLTASLDEMPGITTPEVTPGGTHSYNQYCILVDPSVVRRDELAARLASAAVETAVHYPRALHQQPMFRQLDVSVPVSEDVAGRILALPVHPRLTRGDLDRVVEAVRASVT
jgi:perosamine synthetase